jgi:predicted amidohydrolase
MSTLLEERAAESPALTLTGIQPWAPHPAAAPATARDGDRLTIAANGTRTCTGGWQLHYSGVTPGRRCTVAVEVAHDKIEQPRDVLECIAIWGEPAADQAQPGVSWEYLLPETTWESPIRFTLDTVAPEDARDLTLRFTFRWSTQGRSVWSLPEIRLGSAPVARPLSSVRVCVVTGDAPSRRRPFRAIQENIDFYGALCETASRPLASLRSCPHLIVLPEIALQWRIPGNPLDLAVPALGPETEPIAALARRCGVRILLGLLERDGDAVYNSAVLFGPTGAIEGKYHKVHLAVGGETTSGILPGEGFPVFETEIGRIGCNICMDSSAAESSRMVGLNGADFLLLPIMGDHRADRWTPGPPIFNESRWKAIMRTRAMDNQLCMVVARNEAQGSCIIDRKGDILAWNEGDQPIIEATVPLEDGYRTWNVGCFRAVNWMQRRPHLYQAFTDTENQGSLRRGSPGERPLSHDRAGQS